MGAFSLFVLRIFTKRSIVVNFFVQFLLKKFCLEQFLLQAISFKESCFFTMYSILEKAMWTIVAALLLTLSDGAPGWYPTEAPTTEDLAPEDPMTTTGTWQRAAFKVVGDEESAG